MPAGRAAVVSDYAHSAELPDAIAVRVPWAGDREAALLAARLAELLAEPQRLRAMGEAAREHVRRRHDPAAAAAAVAAACRDWAEAPPPGEARPGAAGWRGAPAARLRAASALRAPPPPSSLTWGRFDGDVEGRGAELPWAA